MKDQSDMTLSNKRIYDRIEYYCVTCGKLRLGPLAAEANNMNMPCEKCGSMHWSTDIRGKMS